MGLDVSHNCWHGAYSAFHRWRRKLAEVAGLPPLDMMEGFFRADDWWLMTQRPHDNNPTMYNLAGDERCSVSFYAENAIKHLPIDWDYYAHDVLTVLLNHSDCDGEIPAVKCTGLADRLDGLLPLLPDQDDGGHIGNWKQKTQQFIDGLRAAAAANEDVSFH